MFFVSFSLTSVYLRYTTPVRYARSTSGISTHLQPQGSSKSTKQVLKRIDYGGSLTMLGMVLDSNIWRYTMSNNHIPGPLFPRIPQYTIQRGTSGLSVISDPSILTTYPAGVVEHICSLCSSHSNFRVRASIRHRRAQGRT